MDVHIKKTVKSLNSSLYKIGKIRRYLDRNSCAMLINGLFTSRLDMCNSLLYGLPKSLTDRLQKLQNRAARILTYTRKYDHISPILKSLHWLPVEKRIIFKVLVITFKALHGLAPSYLSELLHWYTPYAYELRSSTQHLLCRSSFVAKKVPGSGGCWKGDYPYTGTSVLRVLETGFWYLSPCFWPWEIIWFHF